MHNRIRGVFAAIFALMALLVTDYASAQDLNGTGAILHPALIKRIIEDAVNEEVIHNKEDMVKFQDGEHIELSQAWAGTLNAVANLTITTPGPDVYVKLTIGFSCDWEHPSIVVSASEPTVDADYSVLIDILTASLSEGIARAIAWLAEVSQALAGSIEDKLRAEIADQIGSTSVPECPVITAAGDGTVRFDFKAGTECRNGA